MSVQQAIDTATEHADFDSAEQAQETIEATLSTLGESITSGEAHDLAKKLPTAFEYALLEREDPVQGPLDLDEFYDRVADRSDLEEGEVRTKVAASMAGVDVIAGEEEMEDARAQLTPEYDEIFAPAETLAKGDFVTQVRERAGLASDEAARDAIRATLATTGERIARGEAEDLARYLPEEFGEWLVQEASEQATDLSLDEFVSRVAEREGVDEETARGHARAVIDVLEDLETERQFEAAKAQLPAEYDSLFAPE